jgi:DNA replication protein DnaC
LRVPRLAEELRILHGAGSFRRWLQQLAKIDVLVLDDWGIGNLDAATLADLLEVIDDRVGQRATIIAHQLPIEHWHAWLGDPTVAGLPQPRGVRGLHRCTAAVQMSRVRPVKMG